MQAFLATRLPRPALLGLRFAFFGAPDRGGNQPAGHRHSQKKDQKHGEHADEAKESMELAEDITKGEGV